MTLGKIFTSPTTRAEHTRDSCVPKFLQVPQPHRPGGRVSGLGAPSGHAFPQLRGSVAAHFFWSFLSVSSTGPSGLVGPDLRRGPRRPAKTRSLAHRVSTPEPAWRPGRRIPRFLGGRSSARRRPCLFARTQMADGGLVRRSQEPPLSERTTETCRHS